MIELERELSDSILPTPLPERDALADEATELLGYGVLKKDLERETKTSQQNRKLRQAFHDLDVLPFKNELVEQYKNEAIKEFKARDANAKRGRIFSMLALSMIPAGIGLIFYSACTSSLAAGIPGLINAIAGIVCAFFAGCYYDESYNVRWNNIPIDKYTLPIPEFVIQTAIDIKKRCSDIIFEIEQLEAIKNRELRPVDPFLVAIDASGNRYYLEVWNEPEFRKNMSRE